MLFFLGNLVKHKTMQQKCQKIWELPFLRISKAVFLEGKTALPLF